MNEVIERDNKIVQERIRLTLDITEFEAKVLENLLKSTIKEYEFNAPWEYQNILDKIKKEKLSTD